VSFVRRVVSGADAVSAGPPKRPRGLRLGKRAKAS
jgi:hypothetical protein